MANSKEQRNRTILDGVASEDANQKHIVARLKQRFENNRLVALALKRIRQDRQHALTNLELYADDWAFHRGPITKENLPEFTTDAIDRVFTLHQGREMQRERAEGREADGGLMSGFEDQGSFGDLP